LPVVDVANMRREMYGHAVDIAADADADMWCVSRLDWKRYSGALYSLGRSMLSAGFGFGT